MDIAMLGSWYPAPYYVLFLKSGPTGIFTEQNAKDFQTVIFKKLWGALAE